MFSVGARSAGGQAEAARIEASQATPRTVSVGFGVARFLALVLVLAAAGGAIALALVLTGAPLGVQRRVELVVVVASLALLPATLAGLVYEAAAAGGFGLREAADTSVLRSVLDTTFGTVWAVRAGLGILLAAILLAGRRLTGPAPGWLKGCAAICGACLGGLDDVGLSRQRRGPPGDDRRRRARARCRDLDGGLLAVAVALRRCVRERAVATGRSRRAALLDAGRGLGRRPRAGRASAARTSRSVPGVVSGRRHTGDWCWARPPCSSRSWRSVLSTTGSQCRGCGEASPQPGRTAAFHAHGRCRAVPHGRRPGPHRGAGGTAAGQGRSS